jgi:hypothetical protein
MIPVRVVCLLLCVLHGSVAYVRSISEDRFPYMIDTASGKALDWGSGSLLQHVLGSSAVRVSDNRVRFIPAGWALTGARKSSAACRLHPAALCIVEGGELNTEAMGVGKGSRIFPFQSTGVEVHSKTSHSCRRGGGRVSAASPSEVYDVSVCDTVDGSLDVFFTHDRVQLVQININNPLYVFSGIIVVLLVVFITQNLAIDIMTDEQCKTAISLNICMTMSLMLAFCSCVLPGMINGGAPGPFIRTGTLLDLYYLYIVIVYMGIHCFHWIVSGCWKFYQRLGVHKTQCGRIGHLHNVNFMVCAILLSIFSTHGTIETVLTTPLLFVLLFRTIFKMYAIEKSSVDCSVYSTLEAFLISLDCIIVGATHVVGTAPQAETYLHGTSSFCILFFVAHALAYEATRDRLI